MNKQNIGKTIPVLGGVLVFQLALAALLFWQGGRDADIERESLLAMAADDITQLNLWSDEGGQVSLGRTEDGEWQLASGLPANEALLETVLEDLTQLRSGWPVARTSEAHERFQVTEETYRRKLEFVAKPAQGDATTQTLYLGSAPTFKQVHVRLAGEDDIQSVAIELYRLAPEVDHWLDKTLLQPQGEIDSIVIAGKTLSKNSEGRWPALEPGATPNSAGGDNASAEGSDETTQTEEAVELSSVVDGIQSLIVLGLAQDNADADASAEATDDDAEAGKATPAEPFSFTVTAGGETYEYRVHSRGDQYLITRSDMDREFRIPQAQFEDLAQLHSQLGSAS